MITADEIGRALGLPVRRWVRAGVIPSGLTADELEHAALVARLTRPAAENRRTADHAEDVAAWSAAVRSALTAYRAPEDSCAGPPTADPAPDAGDRLHGPAVSSAP